MRDYYNYHRSHGAQVGQTPYERLLSKTRASSVTDLFRDLQRINSGLHLTNGFRIVRRPSMIWPPCKSSEYSVAHSDSRAAAMMSAS